MDLINLHEIDDNPFQTRQTYHDQAIADLAEDILAMRTARPETCGLIHVPVGRRVNGRVQLAAGHSRKRAFDWLHIHNDDYDWSQMPVEIAELDDRAMADIAWSENAKRQNLSAIEEAKAIQTAIEKFGYTLTEIARRWGISKSAASNKLRLLQLPEAVQQMVQDGDLTERHARELLPLVQLADDQQAAISMAKSAQSRGLSAQHLASEVRWKITTLTRQIPPEMLDTEVQPSTGTDCVPVCQRCQHQRRGRCSSPAQFNKKRNEWIAMTLRMATEKTGIPAIPGEHVYSLPADGLARAKKTGCDNLVLGYCRVPADNAMTVKGHPDIIFTCRRKWDCTCAMTDEEQTQRQRTNEWINRQKKGANGIWNDTMAEMRDRFENALSRLMPDDLLLFTAFVTQIGMAVKGNVTAHLLADHFARHMLLGGKFGAKPTRIGDAQVLRARVLALAGLASPLLEAEAHLQQIRDEISEAQIRGSRLNTWAVERAIEEAKQILDANKDADTAEIKTELARLEAAVEEFSQEKR